MPSLNLNERAWALVDDAVAHADLLRVRVHTLNCGARVLDAGVAVPGGLAAGLLLAEICMGGVGHAELTPLTIAGESWPGLHVWTDHPAECCMASQYAGWAITPEGYFAMGSGPLRAKARVEKELYERLGYAEDGSYGVLVLETRTLPTDDVAAWVAQKAGVKTAGLTFAVAPTASLAGGVQVVARVVETGLHKMETLGFDVRRVVSASGTAPLPPTAKNDLRAIGRTNDCVLYGGQARFVVDAGDTELAELAERMPASASSDYGTPFYDIFKRYDNDFYRIDPLLFSPGEVWLMSATSGRTFRAGDLNPEVLKASLYEAP
ncbi:MAG TPA: methenyltetrahydromethanopterin cyclohydrolase [Vicinamibacterales bacterium]|nr:methenyltetrahydromethanopterin cyclohydrolase [Vicinamibacterales bacterium]